MEPTPAADVVSRFGALVSKMQSTPPTKTQQANNDNIIPNAISDAPGSASHFNLDILFGSADTSTMRSHNLAAVDVAKESLWQIDDWVQQQMWDNNLPRTPVMYKQLLTGLEELLGTLSMKPFERMEAVASYIRLMNQSANKKKGRR